MLLRDTTSEHLKVQSEQTEEILIEKAFGACMGLSPDDVLTTLMEQ